MGNFDRRLKSMLTALIKNDEKSRRQAGLKKKRSDLEAMKFRAQFDELYDRSSNELSEYMKVEVEIIPQPETSQVYKQIHLTRYHEYLEEQLALPHGFLIT